MGTADNYKEYVIGSGEGHSLRSFLDESFRFYELDYCDFIEETEDKIRPNEVNATIANLEKLIWN